MVSIKWLVVILSKLFSWLHYILLMTNLKDLQKHEGASNLAHLRWNKVIQPSTTKTI